MRLMAATVFLGTALATAGSFAADANKEAAPAAAGQKIATEVCAACHGVDGHSPLPANPHLAGQHADYIAKQLADFKNNTDRKNAVMMAMAQPLSPADMRAVATHYAAQKPRPSVATNKELVALGQKLYRGGNAATGVPACAGCHSPNGSGIPSQYPRLSAQIPEYTAAQLRAFRAAERGNDANQMMRMIAARMSDQEIAAVAEYLAGLQ
ncbi:MAG: cytochrome c4 [Burkholderiales bacterium]|nr:cytochrome c4 [Burkholderiales bacterium]